MSDIFSIVVKRRHGNISNEIIPNAKISNAKMSKIDISNEDILNRVKSRIFITLVPTVRLG
jgi:hypothetical protein